MLSFSAIAYQYERNKMARLHASRDNHISTSVLARLTLFMSLFTNLQAISCSYILTYDKYVTC